MKHSGDQNNSTPHTPYDVWGVLVEELASDSSRLLWGVSLNPSVQGWRLILKCNYRGLPEVAYVHSDDLRGLFTLALELHRAGSLKWFRDRFPPQISGREWAVRYFG